MLALAQVEGVGHGTVHGASAHAVDMGLYNVVFAKLSHELVDGGDYLGRGQDAEGQVHEGIFLRDRA